MNFEFSEEQNLLREQAQGFLANNSPPSVARRVLEAGADYDEGLWQKVADMGWTATVIPEEYGGLGLSYLELCVIAEELGRAVSPIPFSSSVYLATEALLLAGSEEQKEKWLPRLATGDAIGTLADRMRSVSNVRWMAASCPGPSCRCLTLPSPMWPWCWPARESALRCTWWKWIRAAR